VGACLAVVVLLPVLLAVAMLVRLSSSGPVLLRQKRVGKNGSFFQMYKFRTMFADSDPAIHEAYCRDLIGGVAQPINGAFKLSDDSRIMPIGRVLRRFSLDELPQVFNVLRSDMSLVGPRPPLPYEAALYDERAQLRLLVPPGMTGLWQISGRDTLTFRQMVEMDLTYISSWSFWLDLSIMLRTPFAVISTRGAH